MRTVYAQDTVLHPADPPLWLSSTVSTLEDSLPSIGAPVSSVAWLPFIMTDADFSADHFQEIFCYTKIIFYFVSIV
ncbi:hypothetical protein PAXRUDRAFT_22100 [Paxillus rubicundulus Ve08.2h10]|uniref:Uncharacterized protein n=1 Tax=Paxillus rubicundulus Ve08.2h10 TaxID=930991 RepID=A0A0D0CNM4_9AGAM|nr:hypothetical protein PAXRUDRAFT_22100 [Paxillus rubicundulus Ve08.2h10]